ncbi:antibiotic biosynthesis monooxygenase family protein [Arthrobacter sp. SD76]|uniref:antibiotic biosynthesis monooxygenase family protein n=1 Tax=Arthrobacter sp. SD76 TaxID=3415007 RepID=UPI003C779CDD
MKFMEADPNVAYRQQLASERPEPVVLLNQFFVEPNDVEGFLAAWEKDAAFMSHQPGFIRTQLHRGLEGSTVFVNYAEWESAAALAAAVSTPTFREGMERYPASVQTTPQLLERVAVPGVCDA